MLNAVGAGIAAVVSAQPCHPTYHTRIRALCVTVKKPSNHHVQATGQERGLASRRSRERRELTEETRPTSLRPGGVVAPEVAGLLSKASPRPSTAPLPSFPSPNPPHFLTVIGLLSAGEQFKSTTHSSSLLQGSRERLRAGGSQASLLALGSGSRRCRRRGDSSCGAARCACCMCCCARRWSSRIWRHVHGFACLFDSHAQAVLAAHGRVHFGGPIVRVCVVRVADRPNVAEPAHTRL